MNETFKIEKTESDSGGAYSITVDETTVARMTFSKAGSDRIIIDHTEVNAEYKSRGLGEMMVRKAVDDAREAGINIIPLCPFARSVFGKDPSIRDVL